MATKVLILGDGPRDRRARPTTAQAGFVDSAYSLIGTQLQNRLRSP